jgi:hypothetical protein
MAKAHLSRGNVFVKQSNGGVYLYTQSRGHKLPNILRQALIHGKNRWGNTPVLTRIIFGEMMSNDVFNVDGFSISTELADNDNYILVVDDVNERIGVFTENGSCLRTLSYEEFITLGDSKLTWKIITNGYEIVTNDVEYQSLARNLKPGQDPYPFPGEKVQDNKSLFTNLNALENVQWSSLTSR